MCQMGRGQGQGQGQANSACVSHVHCIICTAGVKDVKCVKDKRTAVVRVCVSHVEEGEPVAYEQPVLACRNPGGILDANEVFLRTRKGEGK